MAITTLLDKLPDLPSFIVRRALEAGQRALDPIRSALDEIIQRRMGDVLDWLRPTPNAVY